MGDDLDRADGDQGGVAGLDLKAVGNEAKQWHVGQWVDEGLLGLIKAVFFRGGDNAAGFGFTGVEAPRDGRVSGKVRMRDGEVYWW